MKDRPRFGLVDVEGVTERILDQSGDDLRRLDGHLPIRAPHPHDRPAHGAQAEDDQFTVLRYLCGERVVELREFRIGGHD